MMADNSEPAEDSTDVRGASAPSEIPQAGDTHDLGAIEIPNSLLQLLPAHFVRERKILPLSLDDEALEVLMSDPGDFETVEMLGFMAGRRVKVSEAGEDAILAAIARHYGHGKGDAISAMRDEFLETHVCQEELVDEDGMITFVDTLLFFPPNFYRESSDERTSIQTIESGADESSGDRNARLMAAYLQNGVGLSPAQLSNLDEQQARRVTLVWRDHLQLEFDALGELFDNLARSCQFDDYTWKRLLEGLTSKAGEAMITSLRTLKSGSAATKRPEDLHRAITFLACFDNEHPPSIRLLQALIALAYFQYDISEILIPLDECRIFFRKSPLDAPREIVPPPAEIKDRIVRYLKAKTGTIARNQARFLILNHLIEVHVEFKTTQLGPTAVITIPHEPPRDEPTNASRDTDGKRLRQAATNKDHFQRYLAQYKTTLTSEVSSLRAPKEALPQRHVQKSSEGASPGSHQPEGLQAFDDASGKLSFRCPSCRSTISAHRRLMGKLAECPSCQHDIRIPFDD